MNIKFVLAVLFSLGTTVAVADPRDHLPPLPPQDLRPKLPDDFGDKLKDPLAPNIEDPFRDTNHSLNCYQQCDLSCSPKCPPQRCTIVCP